LEDEVTAASGTIVGVERTERRTGERPRIEPERRARLAGQVLTIAGFGACRDAISAPTAAHRIAQRERVLAVGFATPGRLRRCIGAAIARLADIDDTIAARLVRPAVAPTTIARECIAVVAELARVDEPVAASRDFADPRVAVAVRVEDDARCAIREAGANVDLDLGDAATRMTGRIRRTQQLVARDQASLKAASEEEDNQNRPAHLDRLPPTPAAPSTPAAVIGLVVIQVVGVDDSNPATVDRRLE
jgi:hypothetical protein